ncbi:hypothetical protein ACGUFB_00105 [Actinotignum schaalii]|uniref:hypothetical protein n=1 Tax=Actinotignum TaxID=1653174 RepID=UPI00373E4F7F
MCEPAALGENVQNFSEQITRIGRLFDPEFQLIVDDAKLSREDIRRMQGNICIRLSHMNVYLGVDYSLFLSHPWNYLTVAKSSFILRIHSQKNEPLIRWDYVREPRSKDIPCSHIQIHAHRDAWTHAMLDGGASLRAQKRKTLEGRTPPVSELHIPLGSKRFRPCLEDVLLFLINEFGAQCQSGTEVILKKNLTEWEKIQACAVVREHTSEAITVLEQMGWTVQRA